jgi:acyl-homoserine-lactone acylase
MKKPFLLLVCMLAAANVASAQAAKANDLWRQVEVIRTAHGVPHIRAANLRAAGYALAWLQCEDYGTATPNSLLQASGRWASVEGVQRIESDFLVRRHRERTLKKYEGLSRDVRDVYEGFAAGVNRYIELNRDRFSAKMPADFTGRDVAATEIIPFSTRKVRNFLNRLPGGAAGVRVTAEADRRGGQKTRTALQGFGSEISPSIDDERFCAFLSPRLCVSTATLRLGDFAGNNHLSPRLCVSAVTLRLGDFAGNNLLSPRLCVSAVNLPPSVVKSHSNDGSNTWAFAPSRTRSGRAILLRNPHLQWSAGYYEAHMTVPGIVDFYGDFRIGGPFAVIGGFNRDLGWSTTNNSQDLDEIYMLETDAAKPDHYLLDGASHPLKKDVITVEFTGEDGASKETREFFSTLHGPVIHRAAGKIYVMKFAGDGELRGGEQFLRMMRARTLKEWKAAMKMRARPTSNFTYADRAGNIFYIWNASLPLLPHAVTDDTTAIPVKKTSEMWAKLVPFESLPQILNPPGGYLHNENSSPHYTNVRGPVDTRNKYPNFEAPELSLRSQLAIRLIGGDEKYTLEDVWRLKHDYRMLTAERVKGDLIAAVKATDPTGDVAAGIELLERWENDASPDSRGSTLFEEWWATYSGLRRAERQAYPNELRFAKVWSIADPFNTPRGLADLPRAVESFAAAVEEVKRRYGAIDVAWGDVHRVRRGKVDVPVGGCGNDLGCFRIVGYTRADDGKLVASAGDGWVFAVEFGDVPRAYSVLAYGQSSLAASPYHSDQAEMFARGEMKKVAFTEKDVTEQAVKRYRPGGE